MTGLALLAALLLQAPPDEPWVSARLHADRIATGSTTTLSIEVESRGTTAPRIGELRLPAGLEVVGTSDFSQLRLAAPGRSVRSTRRDVLILATAPGTHVIPAVPVTVGSRQLETARLELTVSGSGPAPPAPLPAPGGQLSRGDGTMLRLSVQPDTVYVGQQVVLAAEATFAEEFRARQTRPASFEPPGATGLWGQDLPDPITVTLSVDARAGRSVERQTYRRAYFPLREGVHWIPPAHLNYEVRRGFLQPPESRRIASDSVRLVVRPLPGAGRPAAFTGAVGQLEMTAHLAPRSVPVGGSAVLTVEIRGTGNIRGLPPPDIPRVEGLDVLPPTRDAQVSVSGQRVQGTAVFRWVLIPERRGALVVPPVEYAFFDPELRRYTTLRTDTLHLVAVPAVAGQPSDTVLHPMRAEPASPAMDWGLSPWFAGLQLIPLLLVASLALRRRREEKEPAPAARLRTIRGQLRKLAERAPAEPLAGAMAGTPASAAAAEVERLLREAAVACGSPPGQPPEEALREADLEALIPEFQALLADLHRLRFAPGHVTGLEALAARAEALCEAMMEGVAGGSRKHGAPARGALGLVAAVAVLGLAGAAATGFGRAAATPGAPLAQGGSGEVAHAAAMFQQGLELHAQGDAAAAAQAFRGYLARNPRDPAGWHNLGVAAFAAGEPGRAAWAWMRALRLAPRDERARHNLMVVAGPAPVVSLTPPDRLAPGERAVLAGAAWWLLLLALASMMVRGRWQGGELGAAAVAGLALLVFGAAAAAGPGRGLVTPLGQGTAAYAGPSVHDDTVAELPPGTLAPVLDGRGAWLLVGLGDGRRGWVEGPAVASP
jgi:cytochrome c-type biogenesis protein CcmH/NrfG